MCNGLYGGILMVISSRCDFQTQWRKTNLHARTHTHTYIYNEFTAYISHRNALGSGKEWRRSLLVPFGHLDPHPTTLRLHLPSIPTLLHYAYTSPPSMPINYRGSKEREKNKTNSRSVIFSDKPEFNLRLFEGVQYVWGRSDEGVQYVWGRSDEGVQHVWGRSDEGVQYVWGRNNEDRHSDCIKHSVNFAESQEIWGCISSKGIWSLNFKTVRLMLHERNICT